MTSAIAMLARLYVMMNEGASMVYLKGKMNTETCGDHQWLEVAIWKVH
jgi:hypothetical protein